MVNPADVERVKAEIRAAFDGLVPPEPAQLLAPYFEAENLHPSNKPEGQRIQRDFGGKTWMSLDTAFFTETIKVLQVADSEYSIQQASSFWSLSAVAYHYYLPALLLACLEDFAEGNALISTILSTLRPGDWYLYYQGEDKSFNDLIALCTEEQYEAVCAFLGLAFDEMTWYRYLTSTVLILGWNRRETPALTKARAFYTQMHHYQCPPLEDAEKQRLVEHIRAAFDDTPYPGDNALCGTDRGDEAAECAMAFRGADWRTLHPLFLARNQGALSFLTDEGFRYFLPAYLIADLVDDPEGPSNYSDPGFHLTHGLDANSARRRNEELLTSPHISEEVRQIMAEDIRTNTVDTSQRALDKFALLTHPERAAIVAYLQYRAASDSFEADGINEALQNYWLKTLD